jgi:hypothetical protein
MQMKLQLKKDGAFLFEGVYDFSDAESFGRAFSDLWTQVERQTLDKATSVGAFMEMAGESVAAQLAGAEIRISKG